jgi:hypothetical protein
LLGEDQAWHFAGYESTLKDARMSTLDEGLMATLTQEERDAMKEDDVTTESVDVSDQPVDEAKSEDLARTEPASDASDASSVDTKSEQASDTEQLTQESTQVKASADDTDPPQARSQPIPRYDSKLPEDFDAQVKSLADKEAELKRQFKAGEIDLGRQFWRKLEHAGPNSGHSQRLDPRLLRNAVRLTDSEVEIPFRVVVIDVACRSCMNDVRVWKLKSWGDHGFAECNRRVASAVPLQFRSGRSVDGAGNTRTKAQVRIC